MTEVTPTSSRWIEARVNVSRLNPLSGLTGNSLTRFAARSSATGIQSRNGIHGDTGRRLAIPTRRLTVEAKNSTRPPRRYSFPLAGACRSRLPRGRCNALQLCDTGCLPDRLPSRENPRDIVDVACAGGRLGLKQLLELKRSSGE